MSAARWPHCWPTRSGSGKAGHGQLTTEKHEHRAIGPLRFALPELARPSPIRQVGELVLVESGTQESRGRRREWVDVQKPQHFRAAFENLFLQSQEPWVPLAGAQSGEPHLPVQARLVRRDESRSAVQPSRFPFELVGKPGLPVEAPLEDDFGARGGHHCKEPIAVDASKWLDGAQELLDR